MLIVKLQINYRLIQTIGIHNVHPKASNEFQGECPYNIYVADDFGIFDIENPVGQITHNRSEGAETLAAKALMFISELNS